MIRITKKYTIAFLFLLIGGYNFAQINIGNNIILTSVNSDNRQVEGLTAPQDSLDAVNLQYFTSGKSWFFSIQSTNSDTIILNINPTITSLNTGLMGNFISPILNQGTVYLNIQGLPNYIPLKKKGTFNLDSADIQIGQLVTIMFDGINFQCLSELSEKCPNDFIKVSSEYCISSSEHDSLFFWPAVKYCGDRNSRICNWGEWYYACQNAGILGLPDMINNFEWVDGGGNSLGWTTPPTTNTGLQSGDGSCTNIMASIVDTTHNHPRASKKTFHCCYSLK